MIQKKLRHVFGFIFIFSLTLSGLLGTGCGQNSIVLTGRVMSGGEGVSFATVSLYRTGTGQGPELLSQT